MKENYLFLAWILATAIIIILLILKQRKTDLRKYISPACKAVDLIDNSVDIFKSILPAAIAVPLDILTDIAKAAVHRVEALYKLGQIPATERKQAAIDYTVAALKEAGIKVPIKFTKDVGALTDEIVKLLPKTHK